MCDVDGDGDLDIWVDNMGPGYSEQLLINDGSGTFTDETRAALTGNGGSDDNGASCVDFDHDGDFDMAVWAFSGNERILENDGSGNFNSLPDAFPSVGDTTLWGEFGDINGYDKLDAVTGQGEGNPETDRLYLGNGNAEVDAMAPNIIMNETVDGPVDSGPIVHFAVSDADVPDDGPRVTAFAHRRRQRIRRHVHGR